MKFKIIYNARFMFWARGMVLWPFLLLKPYKRKPETSLFNKKWNEQALADEDRIYRHELQHCYQVKQEGRLKFYGKYLWYQVRHGYTDNPYEVDARAHENEPLTPTETSWRRRGKVVL